ncbi:MAG: hypothetical protein LUG16_00380, partial [Candidatus Gastranaerophilales bacterium]|nr:hypothetical protein [Candidatus Gastranaerophilales bacterium]
MDDFHLNKISQKNDAVQGNKKLTSFYIPKDRLEQDVVQLKKSGQQKYLINNVTDRLKSFINKKSVSFGSSIQQEEKPSDEVCKKRQADLENMGVKICSRPLSRLSNEKYNKALSLIGSVDENYIGLLVNLENDYFSRVPELSGIFKNHYFIKDIAELNDFKYNTALNHIKQKKEKNPDNFDDEFFLYKIVMDKSLDDNQFLRAINMLNQGFDIDKITAIVKASTKSDNCNLIAEYLSLSTIKDLAEKNVIDDILDSKNFNEQTMPLIKQISNANNLSDDTKNKLTQYLLLPSIENLCDIPIYDKTLIISNLKDIINKGIIIDGKNYIFNDDEINLLQIPSLIKNMEKSINYTITPTDITEQEMEVFAKDFLANNNKNIENTLKSTD